MAFLLAHGVDSAIATGTNTITVPSTTAGNLQVVFICEANTAGATPGNPTTPTSWTAPAGTGTSQLVGVVTNWGSGVIVNCSFFYRANIPGSVTSVAIPVGANTQFSTAFYGEFSGASTSSPFDQAGNAAETAGATTLAIATAAATAQASELAVLAVWNPSGSNPENFTLTGWSSIATETNGNANIVGAGFWETTGSAAVITGSPTWTGSQPATGLIATFEAPSAGGQTEAIRMII